MKNLMILVILAILTLNTIAQDLPRFVVPIPTPIFERTTNQLSLSEMLNNIKEGRIVIADTNTAVIVQLVQPITNSIAVLKPTVSPVGDPTTEELVKRRRQEQTERRLREIKVRFASQKTNAPSITPPQKVTTKPDDAERRKAEQRALTVSRQPDTVANSAVSAQPQASVAPKQVSAPAPVVQPVTRIVQAFDYSQIVTNRYGYGPGEVRPFAPGQIQWTKPSYGSYPVPSENYPVWSDNYPVQTWNYPVPSNNYPVSYGYPYYQKRSLFGVSFVGTVGASYGYGYSGYYDRGRAQYPRRGQWPAQSCDLPSGGQPPRGGGHPRGGSFPRGQARVWGGGSQPSAGLAPRQSGIIPLGDRARPAGGFQPSRRQAPTGYARPTGGQRPSAVSHLSGGSRPTGGQRPRTH
ncbi:MAG: hypothetical protein NUV54_03090 [Candidatus Taylorbacteria bacterium]|nr:hypothetical protein [Candidatus Taylorbacteria bacterium]